MRRNVSLLPLKYFFRLFISRFSTGTCASCSGVRASMISRPCFSANFSDPFQLLWRFCLNASEEGLRSTRKVLKLSGP